MSKRGENKQNHFNLLMWLKFDCKTKISIFRFKNFGSTVPQPTFENNKLFMKFESNEVCKDNEKYSSLINFICDSSSPVSIETFYQIIIIITF